MKISGLRRHWAITTIVCEQKNYENISKVKNMITVYIIESLVDGPYAHLSRIKSETKKLAVYLVGATYVYRWQ